MKLLDEVIVEILKSLNQLFDLTIKAQKQAMEALIEADNIKAVSVLENDEKINQLEEKINYDVLIAIAKYQPVASDLRRLISTIKVASDLERIGDYAKTISKSALVNNDRTFLNDVFLKNSLKMSKIIIDLLKNSKQAFIDCDVDRAYDIIYKETQIVKLMQDTIKSNPFILIQEDNVDSYMLLMGVLRTLERSRGHIANICEETVFVANGTFVEL